MGGAEFQRIISVSQADRVSGIVVLCTLWFGVGRAQKMTNGLCQQFCLGEICPLSVTLMSDASVPPHLPQVPFKLLPLCWSSAGASLSKFCGPFKRNCLGIQNFLPPTQSPLVFAGRCHGDLSSCHWKSELGILVWGWDSLLPRYPP